MSIRLRRRLDRPAEATRAYRIYFDEALGDLPARRPDARVRIDALRPHVAHVHIASEVAGAQVLVDGVDEGRTPLARAVVVNPGPHQVVVQPPGGGAPWTRTVQGEPGGKIELQVSAPALMPLPLPFLVNQVPEPNPSVPPSAVIDTPVTSRPRAGEPAPFYKHAWFWGVVGAVVATQFPCPVDSCLTSGGK